MIYLFHPSNTPHVDHTTNRGIPETLVDSRTMKAALVVLTMAVFDKTPLFNKYSATNKEAARKRVLAEINNL